MKPFRMPQKNCQEGNNTKSSRVNPRYIRNELKLKKRLFELATRTNLSTDVFRVPGGMSDISLPYGFTRVWRNPTFFS